MINLACTDLDNELTNPRRVGELPLSELIIVTSSFKAISRKRCSQKKNLNSVSPNQLHCIEEKKKDKIKQHCWRNIL